MNDFKKASLLKKKECSLKAEVNLDLGEDDNPLTVFESTVRLDDLVDSIEDQSNLYAQQNGRNFVTDAGEIKAFLGINFVMGINKLPSMAEYWRIDEFIGNEEIKAATTRNRFQEVLRNLHFVNNDDRTEDSPKDFKIRPIIDHLNSAFKEAMSDADEQSIDEHMIKFKGKSSMKQYIKSKPIK